MARGYADDTFRRDLQVQHGHHLVQWQKIERGDGLSVQSLLRICDVFGIKLTDRVDGLGE